jgi:hypothetical protein
MKNSVYVTKTLIANEDQSELDFELYDEFGFSYEENSRFNTIVKSNEYYANANPIRIDRMIEILQRLKDNGSTHVQIEDHCDHHGYEISGFEIRLSTQEEITEYDNKMNRKKNTENKISELKNQIDRLVEEYQKY